MSTNPDNFTPEMRAKTNMNASGDMTVSQDLIDAIRLDYRLAKSAENARIVIDHKLVSFARVYLTAWTPGGDEADRKKAAAQAMRAIKTIRAGDYPAEKDAELCEVMAPMVVGMEPSRSTFEAERKARRKSVEKYVRELPAWERLADIRGFSTWGLGVIVGEAGDLGNYPGCRHLYKRLGLAPDECYPNGEKSTGRMIPRSTRGRIMGIITDPLFRQQWRGEKDDVPAHPIGPYGAVYGSNKARHLAEDKTKGHAHNLARRAMIKALLHDVHRAWHGQPLDYTAEGESHETLERQSRNDRPSAT